MLGNGKVGGIGVDLGCQLFLGMPHGVHGGPCGDTIRGHARVEGLAGGVEIKAPAEFILERDLRSFQIFAKCSQPGEHVHDQGRSLHALGLCRLKFFHQLRVKPDRIAGAVLRILGAQADARSLLIQMHIAPLQAGNLTSPQPGMQREKVNQPPLRRRSSKKAGRFLIRAGAARALWFKVFYLGHTAQRVFLEAIRIHQPVEKREHGTEVEIQGLCRPFACQRRAPRNETFCGDFPKGLPALRLGNATNEKPGFLDVLRGAVLGR